VLAFFVRVCAGVCWAFVSNKKNLLRPPRPGSCVWLLSFFSCGSESMKLEINIPMQKIFQSPYPDGYHLHFQPRHPTISTVWQECWAKETVSRLYIYTLVFGAGVKKWAEGKLEGWSQWVQYMKSWVNTIVKKSACYRSIWINSWVKNPTNLKSMKWVQLMSPNLNYIKSNEFNFDATRTHMMWVRFLWQFIWWGKLGLAKHVIQSIFGRFWFNAYLVKLKVCYHSSPWQSD